MPAHRYIYLLRPPLLVPPASQCVSFLKSRVSVTLFRSEAQPRPYQPCHRTDLM